MAKMTCQRSAPESMESLEKKIKILFTNAYEIRQSGVFKGSKKTINRRKTWEK
jgi:hypothetical protein